MTSYAIAVVTISVGLAQSQIVRPTIAQRAAESGGRPLTISHVEHTDLWTLEELSKAAQLVVIGKLVNPVSHLTQDERDIYTDYLIQVTSVVMDRASVASAQQIGPLPPLTVRLHGGTIVVNGVPVTIECTSPTKWRGDADLLLFLMRTESKSQPNNFEPIGAAAGLFEVTQTGLRSRVAGSRVNEEVDGAPVDQIVQRIKSISTDPKVRKNFR
jgi:hypothetical protein